MTNLTYTTIDENAIRGVEALRYTSVIICLFNEDGNVIYQNSAATATFGTHHDVLKNFKSRFIDPEIAEQVWQAIFEKHSYDAEHLFHSISGTACHQIHCQLIRDPLDHSFNIVTSQEDLSKYKSIEAQLHLTEARYQQLFMGNRATMLLIDPTDGAIIDANLAAANYYGYPLPELKQKYISDINTLSPEQILCEMNKAQAELRDYFYFTHRLASGEQRHVEVHSGPITLNNRPLLYSIIHDITARKAAESALQQSEHRLVEAQRIAKLGNWEWDIQQNKIYWSDELYRLLGLVPNMCEASYELFLEYVHPDDVDELKSILRNALEQKTNYQAEYRIIRDDGAERFVHGEGRFKLDKQGEPLCMFGITQDVTEIKILETSLRQARDAANSASKIKSEFLANVSHELRTPLNAILGYSEILLDEIQDSVQCQSMSQDLLYIHEAGSHLMLIINDILDLSKIEAGQSALKLDYINLDLFIQAILTSMTPLIKKNHNTVSYHTSLHIAPLFADELKLKQILFNLLGNAAKFTTHGHIDINVTQDGNDWLSIAVKDTGIGIDFKQLEHIFEPFSQADASSTRSFGGTGLGLTISRHYCQMMNGSLEVESAPNKGSTFTITLPLNLDQV